MKNHHHLAVLCIAALGLFMSNPSRAHDCDFKGYTSISGSTGYFNVLWVYSTDGCKKIKKYRGGKGRYRFKVKLIEWPFSTRINLKETTPRHSTNKIADPAGEDGDSIKICQYYKRKSGIFTRIKACERTSY